MSKDIVTRIKEHLTAKNVSIAFPATSREAVKTAETKLGFRIPTLLASLYLSIGNGGFGPGYGIIGIEGGRASNLGTLVQAYGEIIRGAEYRHLEWETGLLPFCDWGCNIFSCVDCNDVNLHVFQSEECDATVQTYTLEDFFKMWLDGVSILDFGSPTKKRADIINPFTGKTIRVKGARKKRK